MATFIEEATEKHDGKDLIYFEVAFDFYRLRDHNHLPYSWSIPPEAKEPSAVACPDCAGSAG